MPFSSRSGGMRNRARGGKREGPERSEEHSDFQRVDKEAPSMQIKCCFHNHSSVPLSEVRFFVIKVKGTCTRGCVRSFAPTNQPANQPSRRTNHHPLTHPTATCPQTTLLISITESFGTLPYMMLIKRSLFSCRLVIVFFLSILSFFSASIRLYVIKAYILDSLTKLIDLQFKNSCCLWCATLNIFL